MIDNKTLTMFMSQEQRICLNCQTMLRYRETIRNPEAHTTDTILIHKYYCPKCHQHYAKKQIITYAMLSSSRPEYETVIRDAFGGDIIPTKVEEMPEELDIGLISKMFYGILWGMTYTYRAFKYMLRNEK